jgi:DNA repair photolyase
MEPRAPTPSKRLETIKRLSDAGIPTMVMVAPIIPMLTDPEIERILDAAKAAGAREAGYVLLRLPNEIKELFQQWLKEHRPDALNHVMSLVRSTRGGKAYDSAWGKRMTGDGVYAWTIARRFEAATKRLGLNRTRMRLRTDLFVPPARAGEQLRLL